MSDDLKPRVETRAGACRIDVKRFNVPATIHWTCPRCGAAHEDDLEDQYLGYPTANARSVFRTACGADLGEKDCDYEGEIAIYLTLSLRLATPEDA